MKRYSCYVHQKGCGLVKAEGAIEGSKEEVFAWMREKYGEDLSDGVGKVEIIPAAVFFFEGDCKTFCRPDGKGLYLMEILEDGKA